MGKRSKYKNVLWSVLGSVVIVAITLDAINVPQKSIALPVGWHKASGLDCFSSDGSPFNGRSGWPFVSQRGGDCVASVNHLASAINYSLVIVAILGITAYVFYRISSEGRRVI